LKTASGDSVGGDDGLLQNDVQPGDQAITLAVAGTRKEIEADWAWLEEHIAKPARADDTIKDPRSMIYQVCQVVEDLATAQGRATDEGTADERFRATARAFRHTFGLPETERLVNCKIVLLI
jgi:hypothetical protein